MGIILILAIIMSYSFAITIKFKIKQEESIVVSFLGMILLVYVLGIFSLLNISIWIIVLLFIMTTAYTIIKMKQRKIEWKKVITFPSLIYYGVIIAIYFLIRNLNFQYYDEFMFWGTNVKNMYLQDTLWADRMIEGVHQIYPPFTGILEYIFCKFNQGFSEGICYVAIVSMIPTALLLVIKEEEYGLKSILKIVLTYIATYLFIVVFGFDVANLGVDCVLAILFAVASYYAYQIKETKQYSILGILLLTITLTKTNGMLFAGIIIVQVIVQKIIELSKKRKEIKWGEIKKQSIIIVVMITTIIAGYSSWKIYYTVNGKQIDDRHDKNTMSELKIGEFINTLIGNYDRIDPQNVIIMNNFKNKINNQKIINKYDFNTTLWVWGIIQSIGLILFIIRKEKAKSLLHIVVMNLGFFLFLLSNLYMYMFVFTKYQAFTVMGFERYMASYLLAFILSLIYIQTKKTQVTNIIIMVVIIGTVGIGVNEFLLNPYKMRQKISDEIVQGAETIKNQVNAEEKVYIIDQQEDYGQEFQELRYLITPIQTNLLYEWNIKTASTNLYYEMIISPIDFINKLITEDYNYVYIINKKDSFDKQYQSIIKQEEIQGKEKGILLQVDKENQKLNKVE